MIRHGKQLWPFASRGRAGCSFDSSNVSRVLTHRSRRRQLPGGSKSFRFLSSVNASAAIASRKGESAMDLTHRLLDLQSTPLGSYTSATTIETLDAFRYFASKTPVRLRSANLAHRLLGRYAVEISANNIWAKDESHQLAGMYDDLRKVWLDIDGRIGVEHAEASLRGAVDCTVTLHGRPLIFFWLNMFSSFQCTLLPAFVSFCLNDCLRIFPMHVPLLCFSAHVEHAARSVHRLLPSLLNL